MMPYLFKIGNFELRIYSLMIITGLLICIFMAGRKMVKMGYKKEYLENMIIVVFIAALIGARIYYVIFQWEFIKILRLKYLQYGMGGLQFMEVL